MQKISFDKTLILVGLLINLVVASVIVTNELENTQNEDALRQVSCSNNPCKNGGTCVNNVGGQSFGCFCRPGFYGPYCELPYDCEEKSPCFNGSQCTPYGCKCASGYSGKYCEVLNANELCKNFLCKNGGVCNAIKLTKPECYCLKATYGDYCELKNYGALSCNSTVCFNGGKCIEHFNGANRYAYCICEPGFIGSSCDGEYFKCGKNGFFVDQYGCDMGRYFECKNYGAPGFPNGILYRRHCPAGLRFNPKTTYCDVPENVPC